MDGGTGIDDLLDGLIEREGGYVNHPADRGGPTCWGITEAVARAHGYRGSMRNLPRAEAARHLPAAVLASPQARRGRGAIAGDRRRAVRHRRQHGPGGRHHLPAARADRAQPHRPRLPRPHPRRPHRPGDPERARRLLRRPRAQAAARRCCCARSRRSRASATSAWPSAGPPTKPSFTAGLRTGLVSK